MNIPQLRKEIEEMECDLKRKKDELYHLERNCPHNWGLLSQKKLIYLAAMIQGIFPEQWGLISDPQPTFHLEQLKSL
jgi:hypothetical protein